MIPLNIQIGFSTSEKMIYDDIIYDCFFFYTVCYILYTI